MRINSFTLALLYLTLVRSCGNPARTGFQTFDETGSQSLASDVPSTERSVL